MDRRCPYFTSIMKRLSEAQQKLWMLVECEEEKKILRVEDFCQKLHVFPSYSRAKYRPRLKNPNPDVWPYSRKKGSQPPIPPLPIIPIYSLLTN